MASVDRPVAAILASDACARLNALPVQRTCQPRLRSDRTQEPVQQDHSLSRSIPRFWKSVSNWKASAIFEADVDFVELVASQILDSAKPILDGVRMHVALSCDRGVMPA
jgi:hypothetical protein